MYNIIKSSGSPFFNESGEPVPAFTIKPKPKHRPTDFIEGIEGIEEAAAELQEDETPEEIITAAKAEAKRIIDDANAQSIAYIKSTSERIDAEFNANVQRGFEQGYENGVSEGSKAGYERGFKQGYDDGMTEADNEARHNITIMQQIIEGIDDAKHMMLKKYERSLSDVALAMARMVVKKELETNPKQLGRIIEDAASACKNQEYILVTLSQAGYDLITGEDPALVKTLESYSDDVRFFVDRNMADTDCIIETPIGVIDASVKVQFDNIESGLHDADTQEN